MKHVSLLLLSGLISLAGWAQNTINGSFLHNGITRSYSFYVPAIYNPANPVPLVLNLHGYTSFGWQQSLYGDFKAIADTANFIVVHPEGTVQPGTANTQFWNVGFFPSSVDDVAFLEALIDTIAKSYNINQGRLYSTGMSNGGFMSYELACQSNRFAAVASVTGSMTTLNAASCSPSKPTPIMQIHGTNDATVPYAGNAGFLGIEDVVSYWVTFNNCPTTPTMTAVPDINTTDGATAEHYVYAAGNGGATVEFFKVINGAHTWPGAPLAIDVTCMDFSASKEIWRFFNQFQHPNASISQQEIGANNIQLWPNPANEVLHFSSDQEITHFRIVDMQGRIMSHGNTTTNQTIPVGHLTQGLYILELNNTQGKAAKRFVKN